MIKHILGSILKTTLVALALAGAGTLFNIPFMQSFIGCICAQVIIFYIWNSIVEYTSKVNLEKELTAREAIFAQQGVSAECAHCGRTSFIPIRLDEDNEYDCEDCKGTNSVYVSITTAQVTEPLHRDSLSVSAYIADTIKDEEESSDE